MKLSLIIVSFLGLFLELVFIRWLPANVFSLAYFSNIVLISSFLGLGLGFLLASKKNIGDLFKYFSVTLLAVVILFILFREIKIVISPSATEMLWSHYYFNNWIVLPKISLGILPTLIAVFILSALPFILIGQKTALLMEKFQSPLRAYSLNIFGALLGIAAFSAFSLVGWKFSLPWVWFLVAGAASLFLLRENKWHFVTGSISVLAMGLIIYSVSSKEIWSPYYSILLKESSVNYNSFDLYVNRFFYQRALDLENNTVYRSNYSLPYNLKNPKKVLILGAGTGNDVAIAEMYGVSEIQAVEIDPAIAEIGKQLHPNHPYQNSNVSLFVDDARSFLKRNGDKYDMIILATLDSHALLSARSTVRLENFVYTTESLRDIKKHLNNDGITVLMFSVPEQWLGDKLIKSVLTVFSDPKPIVYSGDPSNLFNLMVIAGPGLTDILKNPSFGILPFRQISEISFDSKNLATDDWPYLYLLKRTIPSYYLETIAILMAISFLAIFALSFKNKSKLVGWSGLNFFSLGAAFLLLETKSITTLSLLFGSTWLVNAFVFGGILIMILLANALVSWIEIKRIEAVYLILGLSLVVNYFLPVSSFLGANFWVRSIGSALFLALPLFFAAIIFAYHFKSVNDLSSMFGVNLMGVVFGGFLEYSSILTGLNFLYVLAGIIYLVSFLAFKFKFWYNIN